MKLLSLISSASLTFSLQFALPVQSSSLLNNLEADYIDCIGGDVPYTKNQALEVLYDDKVKEQYCNSFNFQYKYSNNWSFSKEF